MKKRKMHYFSRVIGSFIVIAALLGCEKENDPLVETTHFNAEEILKLPAFPFEQDTVKFVLLSDIHDNYNLLSQAIEEINQLPDISFIVCCGDLTNLGLESQFESYVSAITESSLPVFSVAGNHDYLSTSSLLFRLFLDESNYSFLWGPYKFIIFDNARGDIMSSDYNWLKNEADQLESMNIIIAHKPPWNTDHESDFRQVASYENTILFLHGHTHEYANTLFNNVPMLVSAEIAERKYYIISLAGDTPAFRTVGF